MWHTDEQTTAKLCALQPRRAVKAQLLSPTLISDRLQLHFGYARKAHIEFVITAMGRCFVDMIQNRLVAEIKFNRGQEPQ